MSCDWALLAAPGLQAPPSPFLQGLLDGLQQAPGREGEVRVQPSLRPPTLSGSLPLPHSPTQLLLSQQGPLLFPLWGNRVRKMGRERERQCERAIKKLWEREKTDGK